MTQPTSAPVFNDTQRNLFDRMVTLCQDMQQKGNKPSIRRLCEQLRCAPNTLLPLYQHWQKEQALAATVDDDLSPAFRQAVLSECARKVNAVREHLQTTINDNEEQLREVQEFLQESESKNAELSAALEKQKAETTEKVLVLEKRLAASEAKASTYAGQLEQSEKKLEAIQEAKHQSEIEAAAAKARNAELEKQLARWEEKVH